MASRVLALVGGAGGAGTTRLTVEFGGTLARAGYDVALFDAAFGTQGLARYVEGRIDPDITALVTGDAELQAGLHALSTDLPGTVALCPARAPFERIARAKTAGAAQRLEEHLAAASLSHDVVLVDTPPVAANQAVAAVTAADRTGVVVPDTRRGRDALAVAEERVRDVGASVDTVLANFADAEPVLDVDVRIPTSDVTSPGESPACASPDATFAPAVGAAVEDALGVSLELEFPDEGRLGGLLDI